MPRRTLPAPSPCCLTYRDIFLTVRDMTVVVRAGALQGYEALMRDLGRNPRPVLRRHAIGHAALADPEALIALDAVALLLEDSASVAGCPDFGLRLADRQDVGSLGPLAVVLQNAQTIEQGIADATRYLFVHSPGYEVVLDEQSPLITGCASLRFGLRLDRSLPQRQLVDGCLGYTWQILRGVAGSRDSLRGVSLPHTPIASDDVYHRFFGAPVFYAQPYAALHADRDMFRAELKAASPVLHQLAVEYIAQRSPPRVPELADRVRRALTATMGAGSGTKAEIAALLVLHPRTLQRRLAQEHTTFEAIRETVYQDATLRYLRETDIPLAQVAGALGYSEQSTLTRSCRRWFGATPSKIRERGTLNATP